MSSWRLWLRVLRGTAVVSCYKYRATGTCVIGGNMFKYPMFCQSMSLLVNELCHSEQKAYCSYFNSKCSAIRPVIRRESWNFEGIWSTYSKYRVQFHISYRSKSAWYLNVVTGCSGHVETVLWADRICCLSPYPIPSMSFARPHSLYRHSEARIEASSEE